jgi:hypothetical protein
MKWSLTHSIRVLTLALLALWQAAPTAQAGSVTIVAVFSNPVLMGGILNDPSVGVTTYSDNTVSAATGAVSSTTDPVCASSSGLCWGTNTPSGPDTYSELSFAGATVSSIPSGQFQIGTITFLNGTSALNTLIFGATLSFYENSVSPSNLLGSDNVVISTTSNQYSGTGLTQAELATDADYINICGNNSNICASSIEAYEDSEGGTGVVVDLYGTIVGDPSLTLTNVALDPSTNTTTGGVIGNEAALGEVPEPSTLALMSAGLVLGIVLARRRALRRLA